MKGHNKTPTYHWHVTYHDKTVSRFICVPYLAGVCIIISAKHYHHSVPLALLCKQVRPLSPESVST